MVRNLFFSIVLLSLLFNSAFAQKGVSIVKTENLIKVDGIFNQEEWDDATIITDFYQREPFIGKDISERTEVYLCYDSKNIYFGFKCYDTTGITAKEIARDVSLGEDDRVQIIFDTFLDKRNGYWFQIGPLGSIGDAIISENGAAFNKQWDGLWEGKAKIYSWGWMAEVAIPFKTLTFKKGQAVWGLKLIRHIKRKLESSYWPVANLDSYKFQISDAGLLQGLEGITQGIGLDINPYAITGTDHKTGSKDSYVADAGVDVFYQVTPGIKAALTYNTDFAQTEVDARQINLTRFSLHFPEKRDFFLDGANNFNFGIGGNLDNPYSRRLIPFFSRRIGLDINGNPIPILGGGKITGQAGNWNMGFLNITDDRPSGKENFSVGRVTRNFGSQSSAGFIATYGNALGESENYLTGADLRLGTSEFLGNKNILLTMYGLKSKTDSLTGDDTSFGAELNYPNDFLFIRAGYHQIGEDFRAGIGFVPRVGIRETYGSIILGPRVNKHGILQLLFTGSYDYITDFNSVLQTREFEVTPLSIRFTSGEEFAVSSSENYDYLPQNFEIIPGKIIHTGKYSFWRHSLRFSSAQRRNFWASGRYSFGNFYNGDRRDLSFSLGYKVFVPLFIGFDYINNNLSLESGNFTTEVYRIIANILFSPDITLSNYVQYDNLSMKMGSQSRFRWIIKPGKEVLLVWNSIVVDPIHQEDFHFNESSVRVKAKYNIRF